MKAFPNNEKYTSETNGMDLRDYFAAKALNSMGHFYVNAVSNDECASKCYEIADAMMKAREQK